MKPVGTSPPRPSATRRGLIAISVIGAAVFAGYGLGRTSREAAPSSALQWSTEQDHSSSGDLTDAWRGGRLPPSASDEERRRQVARIKERVRELCAYNTISKDWEMEREVFGLLEQLSAAELGDFFGEVSHPLQEIRVRLRILETWVLKDGPAAIEATSARLDDWLLACSAYQAWGAKDPDAALKWLREDELTPYATLQKSVLRKNFLYDLAATDLEKALNQVPNMDRTEKEHFLSTVAASSAGDEGKLAQIKGFAAGADEDTRNSIETGIVASIGARSYAESFDYIDSLEASPDRKADLEMSVLRIMQKEKLAESMDAWVARHPDGHNIPERMWEMLGEKLIFHREEMRAWLEDMEPGPVRDAFYQQSVRHFISAGERDKALHYIGLIEEPGQRATALRTMRRMWTESNATEAKTWMESLPESDRRALEP